MSVFGLAIAMESTRFPDAQSRLMEYMGFREAGTLLLVAIFLTVLIKESNKTDIAKIKNLPEIPGVPLFGSLFLLGRHHARNCARLAKDYGDVFQARLGNRVSPSILYFIHKSKAITKCCYDSVSSTQTRSSRLKSSGSKTSPPLSHVPSSGPSTRSSPRHKAYLHSVPRHGMTL